MIPLLGVNGVVVSDIHDTNFNTYGNNIVGLPNGGVVIVGEMYDNGSDFLVVEKFNGNGVIDSSFTLPLKYGGYRNGASSQQDGKIIVIAPYAIAPFHSTVVRLSLEGGEIDTTFGAGGYASALVKHVYIMNLLGLSNGKIAVFGAESLNNGNPPTIVTMMDQNGSIDTTFGNGGHSRADLTDTYEFLVAGLEQPDGKLIFAGMADWKPLLLRLNPDGTRDLTFGTEGAVIDPCLLW